MPSPIRLAILISGSGTTLQNLIDRIASGRLSAKIVQVISNRPDAFGLTRAQRAGIPTSLVSKSDCAGTDDFSQRIFALCRQSQADLVCMAGFLQLVRIPDDYRLRVLNIHPALIPAFCGKGLYGHHVHDAVIASGAKVSGCTVHFADNEYDHGPIILQRPVPVLDNDTPESLAARIFEQECEAYPEAIQLIAENRLFLQDRKVIVRPK
jgi:phosphoribosylglycinamide formyltransferase-1